MGRGAENRNPRNRNGATDMDVAVQVGIARVEALGIFAGPAADGGVVGAGAVVL
jgi:hypothetical protein